MNEDHPSEEYEEIELDPSGMPLLGSSPAHARPDPVGMVGTAAVSPSRRPPMPLPGSTPPISGENSTSANNPFGTGPRRSNPVQRAMSRSAGKRPPPLPPPNKSVYDSLTEGPPLPNPNKGWPKHRPAMSNYAVPRIPPEVPTRKVRGKGISPLDPDAPPLPPKPIDFKELEESLSPKERKPTQEYILDSEELSLENFISKYQDELPLHVRVCKGFYGQSERTSVSEGDTFNIHFIKKSQVVKIQDGCGSSYKVALNSGLEFGIMYNPNKNREEALAGFKFDKVGELFQLTVLPKIVRVTGGWRGPNPESTVDSNELLIVKGVKRRINHKYLKAISLASKEKKELPESCAAKLSTRPYDVRLYLPDLMEMVDNPLPSVAVLFVSSDTAHELPPNIVTSVVTLTSLSTETSIIATSTLVEDFVEAPMVDIPNDLDIEVQVMWPKRKEDTEQLYADTRTLLENFKLSNVATYITNPHSDNNTQSAVYAIVKEGNEMAGVDLVKPSTIYYNTNELLKGLPPAGKDQAALSQIGRSKLDSSSSEERGTPSTPSAPTPAVRPKPTQRSFSVAGASPDSASLDLVEPTRVAVLEDRIKSLESRFKSAEEALSCLPNFSKFESDAKKVSRDITSARADMKRLEGRIVQHSEDFGTTKIEVTKLGLSLQEIKGWCENLQKIVSALQAGAPSELNGHGSLSGPGYMSLNLRNQNSSPRHGGDPVYSEEACQKNREYLGTLDSMQVLSLLEQMGLKKLQENFMAERVTGEILLECDDEVLYQELKISSKIHRVRLMKVISGRHSAESILKGEDPYVYTSPVP